MMRATMRSAWMTAILFAGISATSFAAGENAMTPEPALGSMTLHAIPQSHIDLAWWWRYDPETLDVVVKHTLEVAFGNFDAYPDYTFTFLQVPAIEPLETRYPELFYKLRYYAHRDGNVGGSIPNPAAYGDEGRLAIGSGFWCEVDGCVPDGESLVRQCVYGKRYFKRVFGMDVKTAWFQDAWTHPWTYPQILLKCGMDSYMYTRPRGEGETMCWWEGPDGSRVFAYKPLVDDALPPRDVLDRRLADTQARYGVHDDMILLGVGNHGGGAMRADVERMHRIMTRRAETSGDAQPATIAFSTPARFVEAVLREPHEFPVIATELEPTLRGAYTTQGEIKRGNRQCENLLSCAEKFGAIAAWLGARPYPRDVLFDAWKKLMLNQFHDTISGTDVPPSIEDALRRYEDIRAAVTAERDAAVAAICEQVNTDGPGAPLAVFNPLAWERTDLVEAVVPWDNAPASLRIVDAAGNAIPMQIVGKEARDGKAFLRVLFTAEAIPSLGYCVYWLKNADPSEEAKEASAPEANEIENTFFKVRVSPETGWVESIYDKIRQREVLADGGGANRIQILEDRGDSEGFLKDAEGRIEHNVWDGQQWDTAPRPAIALVENGPVRTTLEVKSTFGLARFTQRIALSNAVLRIDFKIAVDWEGENNMVKLAFPLSVSAPEAACEIPYGVIARPCDGQECTARNWVDLSEGDYGVSLLNDGRYGFDLAPNVLRMSVLRSPTRPVEATERDGVHVLRYALYPHADGWQAANTVQRGAEWNAPLFAALVPAHGGALPPRYAFVEVAPENIALSVLKLAEDSDDLIVRCCETQGSARTASIVIAGALDFDAVHATDLLENSQREIPVEEGRFQSDTGAWSIETYKLIRDNTFAQ